MQTFILLVLNWDPNLTNKQNLSIFFAKSVKMLDNKRLGKQRVEARQILNVILGRTTKMGWKNHPVTKQWTPYPNALRLYTNACILEWVRRGFKNNMILEDVDVDEFERPPFLEMPRFVNRHRARLLFKDPFYRKYKWPVKPVSNGYYWYIDGRLKKNGH